MHASSVPVLKRQRGAVLGWLNKAEAHALARKFDTANDPVAAPGARLA